MCISFQSKVLSITIDLGTICVLSLCLLNGFICCICVIWEKEVINVFAFPDKALRKGIYNEFMFIKIPSICGIVITAYLITIELSAPIPWTKACHIYFVRCSSLIISVGFSPGSSKRSRNTSWALCEYMEKLTPSSYKAA